MGTEKVEFKTLLLIVMFGPEETTGDNELREAI